MVLRDGGSSKDKDVEAFRNKDPERAEDTTTPEQPVSRDDDPDYNTRLTKTLRMRKGFGEMLRDASHDRGRKLGKRVHEADILDEALQEWRDRNGY